MRNIPWYAIDGSGRLGDKVYYQRHGQTICRRLQKNYDKTPTPAQAPRRALFIEATRYAQAAMANPVMKAHYEQLAKNKGLAYVTAISEFMKKGGEG